MIDLARSVAIGNTSLSTGPLGLGTAALGFMYESVNDVDADRAIQHAYEQGIELFDTAPLYGHGLAEVRLGNTLSKLARDTFKVATKVGYLEPDMPPTGPTSDVRVHDYSYDGVLRSFENSLRRLQLDRIDIVHIHDPDNHYSEAMEGAYRALSELRSQGVIRAVGAGMNQSAMLTRFAQEGDFDCFLLAGRYTLLDQSAMVDLLPIAIEKGISIFIGGPLNSGILADPHADLPMFNYEPAGRQWIEKAKKLDAVCQRYNIPLKAVALQFPLAHPAVAAVLSGARSQVEIGENREMLQVPIPHSLWQELKHEGLLPAEAITPQ